MDAKPAYAETKFQLRAGRPELRYGRRRAIATMATAREGRSSE